VHRSRTSNSIWSSWASIWSSSSTWSGWASIWERQGRGTEDGGGQGVVDLEQADKDGGRRRRSGAGGVEPTAKQGHRGLETPTGRGAAAWGKQRLGPAAVVRPRRMREIPFLYNGKGG
jgi:hypothetical protein